MIELVWQKTEKGVDITVMMLCETKLLTWFLKEINNMFPSIKFRGHMMLVDEDETLSSLLLFRDQESQQQALHLLLQPPGEYSGKYIARIPAQEPMPVEEVPPTDEKWGCCKHDDDDDEDDGDENGDEKT